MRVRKTEAALTALAMVGFSACGGGGVRLSAEYVAVHNTMTAMGLAQSGEINEGTLAQGAVARSTMQLSGGDCYTFVAFGDAGVADIDVVVMDDTGTEVAADRTTDGHASTQFCPEAGGEYQVGVRMARGNGGYVLTSYSGGSAAGGGGGGGGGAAASNSNRGTCESPMPITVGTPTRGDTRQGTNAMTGSCIRGGDAPEMVYSLTVEERGQVSVTINSDYDGALYLLGTCGEMRSEVTCNDDAPSTTRSRIEATLDPGTYFVVVDGFGNASGEYELMAEIQTLQNLAAVCQGATPLRNGQAVTGSTAGQPSYFTATCAGGARSPDRVYALDVPTRSRMRLRMQSTYDGAIYVRSNCEDPNSEVACNDDHPDTRHSMVTTTLDPGRYFVYADGFSSGQQGDYSLRADLAPVTGGGGAADTCASAGTAAAGTDIEIDTFSAGDDFAGSCGGQGAPDVVYTLNITSRSRLRANVVDAEFPTAIYLQRTCGQQNTEVACASGGAGGRPTQLDTNLQPGTYSLIVDGQGQNQFGAARVDIQMDDLAALQAACSAAPRIRPGRTITGDTSSSSDRFQASCADGARSNDRVYRLQLRRRSRVRVSATEQYDGAIYIRRDCIDPATEVACNDDAIDNRHSQVETVLDAGTYYVFVDGFSQANQGSFTMDVEVTRP